MKQNTKTENKQAKTVWYKSYVFYGILAIFITLVSCVTFAWFVDDGEDTGVVSFGVIELDKEDSFFRGASVDNVLPGGPMVDAISFKQTDRSRAYYARAKIEFSIPESSLYQVTEIVDHLNATVSDMTYTGGGYKWERQADGYYYLLNSTPDSGVYYMFKVENTQPIVFTEGIKCPTSTEQEFSSNDTENNSILQAGAMIEVAVTIEVIQADKHEGGVDNTVEEIKSAFPAAIKSFSFAFMDGVDAPAVDISTLNVGDALPQITKTNYKIVWFNHKDAIYEPFISSSVRIRPGLKYYGTWFYTGNSGYSANVNGLTAYTGSEQNIILPTSVGSNANIQALISLGNSNVIRVIVPEGYTSILTNAFANMPKLNILMLPDSLVTIGSKLFGTGESALTNVQYLSVPKNVEMIGEFAFNAPSLCQVRFLGAKVNVQNILLTEELNSFFEIIVPDIAHYKTGAWRNYNLVSGQSYRRIYEDGVFYAKKDSDSAYTAYAANRNLDSVEVKPEIKVDNVFVSVETVDNCFNSYNSNLQTLIIREGIREIKSICKSDNNLKTITFGYSVQNMEAYALDNLPALTIVVFLGRVTNYNSNAITVSCTTSGSLKIYVPAGHRSYYISLFGSSAIASRYTLEYGTPDA